MWSEIKIGTNPPLPPASGQAEAAPNSIGIALKGTFTNSIIGGTLGDDSDHLPNLALGRELLFDGEPARSPEYYGDDCDI